MAALVVAAAIAAVATAAAIAWRSQILAGLGLIGAMAVPFATALDYPYDLTNLGTAFAALVLVATAVVALRERWLVLLASAGVVGLLQIGGLVAQTDTTDHVVVALAAAYWLIASRSPPPRSGATARRSTGCRPSFVTVGTAFAGLSAASLFSGDTLGYALLIVGGVELALGAAYAARRAPARARRAAGRRRPDRRGRRVRRPARRAHARACLGGRGGRARLARAALREPRLLLAVARLLRRGRVPRAVRGRSAPTSSSRSPPTRPRAGWRSSAVAIAAAALGATARAWPGELRASEGVLAFLDPPAADFAPCHVGRRIAWLWSAGALALYAAALGILGLFVHQRGSTSIAEAWAWGHVATRGLVVGLAIALVLAWPYTRVGRHSWSRATGSWDSPSPSRSRSTSTGSTARSAGGRCCSPGSGRSP